MDFCCSISQDKTFAEREKKIFGHFVQCQFGIFYQIQRKMLTTFNLNRIKFYVKIRQCKRFPKINDIFEIIRKHLIDLTDE